MENGKVHIYNTTGSCILTVTTSTYPRGAGPQANDVLTLDPGDFDHTANTLTVSHGGLTATSAAGVAVTSASERTGGKTSERPRAWSGRAG